MRLTLRSALVVMTLASPASVHALDGPVAEVCEWPSALWGVCSTALIHPRVAVASGHCHGGGVSRTMEFGENNTTPALTMGAMCYTVPGVDLSYCVLNEAVDVPFVPPAMGCELMGLGDGGAHPGYGQADYGGMYYSEGTKRVSSVHIDSVSSSGFVVSGPASRANDSGSPIYSPAPDGTWRTLGVVLDSDFVSHSSGVILAPSIAYIEMQTGIDVTPCTTADGVWAPSAECRNFPRTSQRGAGTWPSCYFDLDPAYSDSCGAPYATTPADAGVDMGTTPTDAGVDMGSPPTDAGIDSGTAPVDAGTSDLGVANDSGVSVDSGVPIDSATPSPDASSGINSNPGLAGSCSCRATGADANSHWLTILVSAVLLGMVFARRRRGSRAR